MWCDVQGKGRPRYLLSDFWFAQFPRENAILGHRFQVKLRDISLTTFEKIMKTSANFSVQ
ncbi:MAG TPA: hypothetical protein DDZ31_04020 [Actinobacteria bacterium]|nr:hypothetical protein [Actinomycetota bacterium]